MWRAAVVAEPESLWLLGFYPRICITVFLFLEKQFALSHFNSSKKFLPCCRHFYCLSCYIVVEVLYNQVPSLAINNGSSKVEPVVNHHFSKGTAAPLHFNDCWRENGENPLLTCLTFTPSPRFLAPLSTTQWLRPHVLTNRLNQRRCKTSMWVICQVWSCQRSAVKTELFREVVIPSLL